MMRSIIAASSRSYLMRLRSTTQQFRRAAVSKSILDTIPQSAITDCTQAELKEAVSINPRRLIVLDDDPTGCQTVYDVNVLLDYSIESIQSQLRKDDRLFYILTNTRSLPEAEAVAVTKQVIRNVTAATERCNYPHPIQYISRSDSTLRGHYPAEVNAIADALAGEATYDGTVIMPAFFEGGRLTFEDIHYVEENGKLIPAGETPFAKDAHFSFQSSNLKDWVAEKAKIDRERVVSISLHDIRQGGPMDVVADKLEHVPQGTTIVVNSVHQHDMNMFMLGLLQAEANGMHFIYRTAASFVASRAGLEPRPLLSAAQLQEKLPTAAASGSSISSSSRPRTRMGGLVVVGSYVPKTSRQLAALLQGGAVAPVELPVSEVIAAHRANDQSRMAGIAVETAKRVQNLMASGEDVVLYTTRGFIEGTLLSDGAAVSDTLTEVVRLLPDKPSFLIAKGGITSHDVAQKGLSITTARVLGQVEPGIPVWRAGKDSRHPDMNYVVFPGNVGDDEALLRVAVKFGVKYADSGDFPSSSSTSSSSSATVESAAARSTGITKSSLLLSELSKARSSGYALAAFNVYNLEGSKAAVAAAEAHSSPIILQMHPSSFRFGGRPLLDMLCSFRKHASVPVFVHIDHAGVEDEADVIKAISCGVDSVMVDGSALSLEENIAWTSKMVKIAHEAGVAVEAELGRLAGEEDGLSISEKEAKMTDPVHAELFVQQTNIDMLAVTIGNVHGNYSRAPHLDFPRLEDIARRVPRGLPLVLHGASGLSRGLIEGAIARGVCKFNVNTDLRAAAMKYVREAVSSGGGKKQPKVDVLQLMEGTTAAMAVVAAEKIRLFRPVAT